MNSPKIMMITPCSSWPGDSGGRIRSGMIAEGLAEFAKVRVLSIYHDRPLQTPASIEEIVMRPDDFARIWSLRNSDHPLAPMIPEMVIHRINRHIAEFRPDIIFFEETVSTGFMGYLDLDGIRSVFSTQNVDSDIFSESGNQSSKALINARYDESNAINNTDYLIACSKRDADRFNDMTGATAFILDNPIPNSQSFNLPITSERYANPDIIFIGSFSYAPNIEASRIIQSEILPLAPKQTKAVFVGRNAHILEKSKGNNPQVEIHSDVPETLSYLARFGQTLMPIMSGGGTRLKVLEAMAAGVVVVATEKAVEGIGLVPNKHYRMCKTKEDFVNALRNNSANPSETAKLAQNARDFVYDNYGDHSFKGRLHEIVDKIMHSGIQRNLERKPDFGDKNLRAGPSEKSIKLREDLTKKAVLLESVMPLFSRLETSSLTEDDLTDEFDEQPIHSISSIDDIIKNKLVSELDITPFIHIGNPDELILDVGAHYGYTVTSLRNLPLENFIHSIEPMKVFNSALERIVENDRKYSYTNIALSDKSEKLDAYNLVINGVLVGGTTSIGGRTFTPFLAQYLSTRLGESWLPEASSYDVRLNKIEFETKTLDSIVSDSSWLHYGRKISGLKIDVEGHEYHVLEGASHTLKQHKPLVMVEVIGEVSKMNSVMKNKGYIPFERVDDKLTDYYSGHYNMFYCHEDMLQFYRDQNLFL